MAVGITTFIEIFILCFVLYKDFKKEGMVTVLDQGKVMFMLWLVTIVMYNFKLSGLYKPNLSINFIVAGIWIPFLIFSRFIYIREKDVYRTMKRFEVENYDIYYIISNIIFCLGTLAFLYNVFKFGLAIAGENKIEKQMMTKYTAYIVYMLVLCAQIKYILYRRYKKKQDLILLILSFIVLFLTLNRGPLTFVFATIVIYEMFNFIVYKKHMDKSKIKKTYIAAAIVFVMFIELFGFVGNLRVNHVMKNYYRHTINEHYMMSKYTPSGFLWLYIYLTSPLENASHAISHQHIEYTYFNNLFYPFIKFGANITGNSSSYVNWLQGKNGYNPYLEKRAGLTVMTFITEAFQDFGYLGLLAYILVYMLIAAYAIRVLAHSSRFSSLGKILIYSNILSIILWSVFVNSLKLAVVILNVFVVIFIENFFTEKNIEKIKEIKGKMVSWKN